MGLRSHFSLRPSSGFDQTFDAFLLFVQEPTVGFAKNSWRKVLCAKSPQCLRPAPSLSPVSRWRAARFQDAHSARYQPRWRRFETAACNSSGGRRSAASAPGITPSAAPTAAKAAAGTVRTDKFDYQPGETAVITGGGFAPGEECDAASRSRQRPGRRRRTSAIHHSRRWQRQYPDAMVRQSRRFAPRDFHPECDR